MIWFQKPIWSLTKFNSIVYKTLFDKTRFWRMLEFMHNQLQQPWCLKLMGESLHPEVLPHQWASGLFHQVRAPTSDAKRHQKSTPELAETKINQLKYINSNTINLYIDIDTSPTKPLNHIYQNIYDQQSRQRQDSLTSFGWQLICSSFPNPLPDSSEFGKMCRSWCGPSWNKQ